MKTTAYLILLVLFIAACCGGCALTPKTETAPIAPKTPMVSAFRLQ